MSVVQFQQEGRKDEFGDEKIQKKTILTDFEIRIILNHNCEQYLRWIGCRSRSNFLDAIAAADQLRFLRKAVLSQDCHSGPVRFASANFNLLWPLPTASRNGAVVNSYQDTFTAKVYYSKSDKIFVRDTIFLRIYCVMVA